MSQSTTGRSPQKTGRAALYARISHDPEGRRAGVERQRKDCHVFAAEHGLTIDETHEFIDNDVSASTLSRKPRPQYKAMLAAARRGEFDAIITYSTSRLTRRPRELEDVIDFHTETGVRIFSTRTGDYNLNTARGRKRARDDANDDAHEAEQTGERVARAAQQRAEQGKFHGGPVPFGFEPVKELVGDQLKVVALRHHPVHAEWVREAASRVLAGESLHGVARTWNLQGRRTPPFKRSGQEHVDGSPWGNRTLKRLLVSPAIAGLRRTGSGFVEATDWKPVITRQEWEQIGRLLTSGAHQPRPFPTAKSVPLLSKYAVCGRCQHALTPWRGQPRSYICSHGANDCGKMRIKADPVEAYVAEALFDYLDSDAFRAALARRPGPDLDAQRDLATAIERDEAALAKADDDRSDGLLDDVRYRRQVDRLTARIRDTRAALDERTRQAAAVPNLPSAADVRAGWDANSGGTDVENAWRWQVLGLFVERVIVQPHPDELPNSLPRRRGESDADLQTRRAEHQAAVLRRRVELKWRVS